MDLEPALGWFVGSDGGEQLWQRGSAQHHGAASAVFHGDHRARVGHGDLAKVIDVLASPDAGAASSGLVFAAVICD